MARLDISKALLLISSGLDEEAQEAIAEKAAREDTTVKALKEELRKAKLQVVQETGAAAEIREELKRIRSERESLENQLKATIEGYQKRMDMDEEKYRQQMDEECGKAYRRGVEEKATGLEKEIRKEFQDKIDYINSERARLEEARKDLTARLEEAEKGGSARWDEGFQAGQKEAFGLRNELNKQTQYARELKKNQDDLLAAAADAEKRAADAEAELEALKAGRDPGKTPAAITLARAVNAFMAECELMPWYPAELQAEAGPIRSSLEQLDDWCTRMHGALVAAVPGEGAVE
jgi:chromosome segregation ATPase